MKSEIINTETLNLHIAAEEEKIMSEMKNGGPIKADMIRVKVRIRRYKKSFDMGDSEIIYQNEGLKISTFTRWKWFFRYRAAKEQIKTPKQVVRVEFISYPVLNAKDVLEKALKNKLTAAKADVTKLSFEIARATEKAQNSLLFWEKEEDQNYQKAAKKLEDKKALVLKIENELKELKQANDPTTPAT